MAAGDITIRPATPARDAEACAAIYAPFVRDTVITFDLDPPSPADMARSIAELGASHAWLVIEEAGPHAGPNASQVLGYANAGPHMARPAYDRTAFTGIYLAQAACARGLGRRLYTALIDKLAAKHFHVALGCITLPNPASIALHEALGFRQVGHFREVGWKHGQWLDVGWWERLL